MTTPDTQRPRPGADILRTALRRNVGAMARGTVLMGLYQAGETAFPIALGLIVEHTMRDRSLGALGLSIAALAVIITTVSLSWRFGMRILQKANTTEAHRWRVRVAACGLQPVARDVDLKSGEVLTIATEDADQTADIIEVVPLLVSSLVAVLVAAVALGLADVRLGLLVIVGTVAILSILSVMSRRIGASTREQQARVARAGAKVADLITGLRPLHGFGGNHAAFLSYREVSTEAKRQAITVARVNGVYAGTALALNAVLAAAVTLTAGWLAFGGRITIGELVMAVGLAQFIMEPLKTVLGDAEVRDDGARVGRADGAGAGRAAGDGPGPGHARPRAETWRSTASGTGPCASSSSRCRAGEFVAIAAYQPRAAADLASILAVERPARGVRGSGAGRRAGDRGPVGRGASASTCW